jgi:hypothetical protein
MALAGVALVESAERLRRFGRASALDLAVDEELPRDTLGLAGGTKQLAFQRIEAMSGRKKPKSGSIPHHNSRGLRTDFDNVTV